MPLTRANVTAASRVMLPTYVLFFGLVGANYLITPRARLIESPALEFADQLLPLPAWGLMFAGVAVLMLAAITVHNRVLFRAALWVCIVSMVVWAGILGLAALLSVASPTAPVWPLFVVACCVATDRSLLFGEVQ